MTKYFNGGKLLKKIIFVLTIILLLIVISFTIFMVINKYSFYDLDIILSRKAINDVGIYKTIDISNEEVQIGICKNTIYVFSTNNYVAYNTNGDITEKGITSFSNPKIVYNDKMVMVYNDNNSYYEIFMDGKSKEQKEIGNIIALRLNQFDYITVIKSIHDGYTGEVNVTNTKKDFFSTIKYANLYPIAAIALQNSNTYVVTAINTVDVYNTSVEIYDMFKNEPIAGAVIEGNFPYISSLGNDKFIIASKKGYRVLNEGAKQLEKFDGEVIEIKSEVNNVYIAYNENGKNYIKKIDETGKSVFTKQVEYKIIGIDTYKEKVVVFGEKNIGIYSNEGKNIYKLDIFKMVDKVLLLDNNSILISGNDNIVLYKYQ